MFVMPCLIHLASLMSVHSWDVLTAGYKFYGYGLSGLAINITCQPHSDRHVNTNLRIRCLCLDFYLAFLEIGVSFTI